MLGFDPGANEFVFSTREGAVELNHEFNNFFKLF